MKDVAGKVAFITGAASGMGLGMARAFSAAGMKVMLGDIEKTALDKAVAELKAQGRDVAGVVTDVTRRDSVFAAAQATITHHPASHDRDLVLFPGPEMGKNISWQYITIIHG